MNVNLFNFLREQQQNRVGIQLSIIHLYIYKKQEYVKFVASAKKSVEKRLDFSA